MEAAGTKGGGHQVVNVTESQSDAHSGPKRGDGPSSMLILHPWVLGTWRWRGGNALERTDTHPARVLSLQAFFMGFARLIPNQTFALEAPVSAISDSKGQILYSLLGVPINTWQTS